MSTAKKSPAPLLAGLLLVVLGGFLLAANWWTFQFQWTQILKFTLPSLLVVVGILKLVRHFAWSEERLLRFPRKAGLLSGIFWTFLGTVILLDLLDYLEALRFVGAYWPLVLILFGLGKIVDFYRLKSPTQVRTAEIFGVVFIISFGLVSDRIARAHYPLIDLDLPGIAGWPVRVDEPRFRFESTEKIEAQGLQEVEITNLYGDVRVEPGLLEEVQVTLTRVVQQKNEEEAARLAQRLAISSRPEGGTLRLGTNREELGEQGSRLNTHLSLKIPPQLRVRVVNRYGDVRVAGLQGGCQVDNSYGEVVAESIGGLLQIENQYESVLVRNHRGNVKVSNRRGSVRVEQVQGNLDAATDYESISAKGIDGEARARNHFGSVRLEKVSGEAVVDGSGTRVIVTEVGKAVRVKNSHKRVSVENLQDSLQLDTSYSEVRLVRIDGPVSLTASHSRVDGEDLRGGLTVQAQGTRLSAREVQGPIKVVTSLQLVSLQQISGPADIQNEFGEVNLLLADPLNGSVTVTSKNGEITLSLPARLAFVLMAETRGGKIESDFGSPRTREEQVQFLEVTQGGGGPEIRLQTTHASIRVRKRG